MVEHEGNHIRKWDARMERDYWTLGGQPIGPVTYRLAVEFDDEACAEEAATAIAGLLKLKGWAK